MRQRFALAALAAAALFAASNASAAFYVDDTTGGPTFDRPFEDFSGLSPSGLGVVYDSFSFSVDTAGSYVFRSFALPLSAPWDNFLFLYQGSFDANNPLVNGIAGNDDFNATIGRSGFEISLATGVAYTLVTAGFESDEMGRYVNVIRGPGEITAPVPEPETYAMMLAGLAAIGFLARRRRS
ncbi:MAG: PEP-CTERM sorting domain-containing protein [Rubrivivax sp.]|nr:PEP-CTERM sorting domain-containing protein [Rubrivivax sp.]